MRGTITLAAGQWFDDDEIRLTSYHPKAVGCREDELTSLLDNTRPNRDGIQITQALSRAVNDTYWSVHPQVIHDLHESVPLLYISTGHGPYSRAVDPVTISEWTQFGHHETGALAAQGLPGVWTWGFFDGWWPGYLNSVANTLSPVLSSASPAIGNSRT